MSGIPYPIFAGLSTTLFLIHLFFSVIFIIFSSVEYLELNSGKVSFKALKQVFFYVFGPPFELFGWKAAGIGPLITFMRFLEHDCQLSLYRLKAEATRVLFPYWKARNESETKQFGTSVPIDHDSFENIPIKPLSLFNLNYLILFGEIFSSLQFASWVFIPYIGWKDADLQLVNTIRSILFVPFDMRIIHILFPILFCLLPLFIVAFVIGLNLKEKFHSRLSLNIPGSYFNFFHVFYVYIYEPTALYVLWTAAYSCDISTIICLGDKSNSYLAFAFIFDFYSYLFGLVPSILAQTGFHCSIPYLVFSLQFQKRSALYLWIWCRSAGLSPRIPLYYSLIISSFLLYLHLIHRTLSFSNLHHWINSIRSFFHVFIIVGCFFGIYGRVNGVPYYTASFTLVVSIFCGISAGILDNVVLSISFTSPRLTNIVAKFIRERSHLNRCPKRISIIVRFYLDYFSMESHRLLLKYPFCILDHWAPNSDSLQSAHVLLPQKISQHFSESNLEFIRESPKKLCNLFLLNSPTSNRQMYQPSAHREQIFNHLTAASILEYEMETSISANLPENPSFPAKYRKFSLLNLSQVIPLPIWALPEVKRAQQIDSLTKWYHFGRYQAPDIASDHGWELESLSCLKEFCESDQFLYALLGFIATSTTPDYASSFNNPVQSASILISTAYNRKQFFGVSEVLWAGGWVHSIIGLPRFHPQQIFTKMIQEFSIILLENIDFPQETFQKESYLLKSGLSFLYNCIKNTPDLAPEYQNRLEALNFQ